MPTSPLQTVLCYYGYDALDRSITWTPDRQAHLQRFYCQNRLTTEIQNAEKRSIFQHDDQVLAQHNHLGAKIDATLLATDQQRSVLNALNALLPHNIAYSPYGHRPSEHGLLSLLGFNGEPPDRITGHYHLGNGHRQFNPVLMRFNSPDNLSPFGKGGVNAYAYCENDPINWTDPNGRFRFLGIGKKSISSQKAANLANEMTSFPNTPTVKYGYRRVEGPSTRTINLEKYKASALTKISDALTNNTEVATRQLEIFSDMLIHPASTADLSKLSTTAINRFADDSITLKNLGDKILKHQDSHIPTKIIDQHDFIRTANRHYAELRRYIPNFDKAHLNFVKFIRTGT